MSEETLMAIADGPTIARQAEQIAELERQLATALAAERYWQEQHAAAWKLIGRCDFAFQLITTNKTLTAAKRTARQLRADIEAKVPR